MRKLYVVVPKDVKVVDTRTGRPVLVKPRPEEVPRPWVISHEEFVLDILCGSPIILKNGEGDGPSAGMQRQRRIQTAFKDSQPGSAIEVSEADCVVVIDAIKQLDWAPEFRRYAAQILPHVQAWEDALIQDEAWKSKRDEVK